MEERGSQDGKTKIHRCDYLCPESELGAHALCGQEKVRVYSPYVEWKDETRAGITQFLILRKTPCVAWCRRVFASAHWQKYASNSSCV